MFASCAHLLVSHCLAAISVKLTTQLWVKHFILADLDGPPLGYRLELLPTSPEILDVKGLFTLWP